MKISEHILRFFFPLKCIVCGKVLPHTEKFPYCHKCRDELNDAKIFSLIEKPLPSVDAFTAFYRYSENATKYSVFHAKKCFSKPFANFFEEISKQFLNETKVCENADVITFSTRRLSEKMAEGFDQAEEMAKIISKISGVECIKALKRTRRAKKQRLLSPEERFENVKNIFECTADVQGKTIVLVDDVVTTGATIWAAAKALQEKGAAKVRVVTFSL